MPTVKSDGVTIHYRDEGRGMPVLLMHAFPLSSEMFDPQVAALKSKYRFILPDHRGFGRSDVVAGKPAEMAQLARDAIAVLNALSIPRAVIGGVSMGGYATMALLRENPERARALVLIDTQMGADDDAGKARREEVAKATEARGMSAAIEAFLPRLLSANASSELRARVTSLMQNNKPEGSAAALRGMALRPDSRDVLARYTGPALVVVGEDDVITGPDKAQQMGDLLVNAKLARISRAGHLANMEAPEEVNRTLDAFLGEVERS
jgi:pimeloyl-ACP methyl ester carboxylesterase